jgi:hypothetical protein
MPLKHHINLLVNPKADSIHFDIIEISLAISFELRPAKGTKKPEWIRFGLLFWYFFFMLFIHTYPASHFA